MAGRAERRVGEYQHGNRVYVAVEQVDVADADPEREKRRRGILAALAVFGPRCPKCGGILMRSRSRRLDHFLKLVSKRRPHRCRRCQWRGWRHPAPLDDTSIQRAEQILTELKPE